jgi:acetyltransferase-like isoleucine patch superfamily enzyme
MCYIDATGGIEIGNDVSIAHGTIIMFTTHHDDNLNTPIKDQPVGVFPMIIEKNVWIGVNINKIAGTKTGD